MKPTITLAFFYFALTEPSYAYSSVILMDPSFQLYLFLYTPLVFIGLISIWDYVLLKKNKDVDNPTITHVIWANTKTLIGVIIFAILLILVLIDKIESSQAWVSWFAAIYLIGSTLYLGWQNKRHLLPSNSVTIQFLIYIFAPYLLLYTWLIADLFWLN